MSMSMSMTMMDSSGSSSTSSTRSIFSPAGLRVLVVDDDATWLKILEKMLKKCTYQVTTCNLAREALKLLRERKDGFDIVISDVNMPDMNGFQFLEHVGLEMDLPVIMMSVDGETRRVMKGVQHGACDYLRKPIRMKELRNIWQHVFRKRMHDVSLEDFLMTRSRTQLSDVFGGESVSGKKRSIDDNHSDRLFNDPFSAKRARVVWTVDLHQKFVEAVNQIGLQKVGPKKILDLMGVPWLTRENVASHLQKYRLYLSRLQKENETKAASGGMQQSDISLNELAGNINNIDVHTTTAQRTTTMQQNIPVNGSCAISGQTTLIHNDEQKISTGNLTEVLSTSRSRDAYELAKDKSVEIEPSIQVEFSSSAPIQLNQAQKPDYHLEHRFDHIPLPQHHSEIGNTDCSFLHIPGSSREYIHKPIQPTEKPSDGKIISRNIDIGSEAYHTATVDSSTEMENHFADCHVLDPSTSSPWYAQKHIMEHNLFEDLESYNRNMFAGAGSALNLWDEFTAPKLWDEVFHDHSSQGDFFLPNANFGDLESPYYTYQQFITAGPPDYTNQERITDTTPQLYSSLKFDSKDHKEQEK